MPLITEPVSSFYETIRSHCNQSMFSKDFQKSWLSIKSTFLSTALILNANKATVVPQQRKNSAYSGHNSVTYYKQILQFIKDILNVHMLRDAMHTPSPSLTDTPHRRLVSYRVLCCGSKLFRDRLLLRRHIATSGWQASQHHPGLTCTQPRRVRKYLFWREGCCFAKTIIFD